MRGGGGSAGSPRMHWAEPERDGPWGFARRALYADLMVLGQRDRSDLLDSELPGDFLPSVLVDSGRPALVLPWAGPVADVGVMGMVGRADAVGGSGAVGVTESGSLIRARWRLSLSLKSRLSTS